jgi:aspartyl-tRNA(Asn)/glutamyl-tRNA(Gln) amidotransferase subunit B
MIHDLLGQLTRRDETFAHNSLSPQQLGDIIDAVEEGKITTTGGKMLLRHLLDTRQRGKSPGPQLASTAPPNSENRSTSQISSIFDLIKELGLSRSSSMTDLERCCQEVIDQHPEQARKVMSGQPGVLMFLVGQVMKRSRGSADPLQARQLLEKKLISRDCV